MNNQDKIWDELINTVADATRLVVLASIKAGASVIQENTVQPKVESYGSTIKEKLIISAALRSLTLLKLRKFNFSLSQTEQEILDALEAAFIP